MRFKNELDELEKMIIEGAKECDTGSDDLTKHIDQISKIESIHRQNAEVNNKKKADDDRKKIDRTRMILDGCKVVGFFGTSLFTFWISTKIDMIGSSKSKGYSWFKDLRDKANAVNFTKI